MVRRRSLAFVGVAALVPLVASAVSAQAASGSLAVTTLGRHGARVSTTVTVVAVPSGQTYRVTSGKRISLPAGRATVALLRWQASVHNPASGAVALRSEVTDAAGDRSVETVYRAYAIG